MAHVQFERDLSLSDPTFVEGLPGAGLVGKIAADHLIQSFEMEFAGSVHCDGLPRVAVYHGDESMTMPPVRLYADEGRDLLVLQSDVPVSPSSAPEFAGCVMAFLRENDAFPVFLSGLPEEKDGTPDLYGINTGDAAGRLDGAGIDPPEEAGLVSGPTGALIHEARRESVDAVGLVVQTQAKFPDPEAARAILKHGIEPLAGVEVETDSLVEKAEEIREAKERLAEQVQDGGDESTQAQPIKGFQ